MDHLENAMIRGTACGCGTAAAPSAVTRVATLTEEIYRDVNVPAASRNPAVERRRRGLGRYTGPARPELHRGPVRGLRAAARRTPGDAGAGSAGTAVLARHPARGCAGRVDQPSTGQGRRRVSRADCPPG